MSYRYMRLILLFDLPMVTAQDRRAYTRFHKELIRLGFYMFQYSVYVKLAINRTVSQQIKNKVRNLKPERGFISILEVTEKQFNAMEFIIGGRLTNVINSIERIVILED